jgi:hypothetical protein
MTKDLDEDFIERTIRRVAEAKAARATDPSEAVAPPAPAPGAQSSAPETQPLDIKPRHEQAPKHRPPDEDQIEATIRRVAAQAAQAAAHDDTEPLPPQPTLEVWHGRDGGDGPRTDEREPEEASEAAEQHRTPDIDWQAAVARIEAGLQATNRDLHALTARVDAVVPLLERMTAAWSPGAAPPRTGSGESAGASDDDSWDDSPQISRLPMSAPPRPPIFRDPSPRTATAERLEPVDEHETVIDTRPIPKPLPPLHVESKRGLDLLPRTYRITVEDKRRGVDLVPLHRALLGMDGVRDMSLLSYANGIAIVSVETTTEIAPDVLSAAVSRAMAREAKVEVHNETTMVIKLAED